MLYKKTMENRKVLVNRLQDLTGTRAVYTRMPECAFVIDGYKVEMNGTLIVAEGADMEPIETLMAEGLIIPYEPDMAEAECQEEERATKPAEEEVNGGETTEEAGTEELEEWQEADEAQPEEVQMWATEGEENQPEPTEGGEEAQNLPPEGQEDAKPQPADGEEDAQLQPAERQEELQSQQPSEDRENAQPLPTEDREDVQFRHTEDQEDAQPRTVEGQEEAQLLPSENQEYQHLSTEEAEAQPQPTEETEDQITERDEAQPTELDRFVVNLPMKNHSVTSLHNLVNMVYARAGLISKATGGAFSCTEDLVKDLEGVVTIENLISIINDHEAGLMQSTLS